LTSAIVPAAGSSSRMGRPKLLLPYRGTTVAGALLATLRRAGVERIVLVAAAADTALQAWARDAGVTVAVNQQPERGMLSSILAGLDALGGAAAVQAGGRPLLVTPADLPAIEPSTIQNLIDALARSDAALAVPAYRGKRGHPLVIAARVVSDLATLDPSVGLRQLLDRHPVLDLAVDDPAVVSDVDTPAEYESLRARSAPQSRPPR
jgi:CTP:molybdopterin cytidylyltransferase MocA